MGERPQWCVLPDGAAIALVALGRIQTVNAGAFLLAFAGGVVSFLSPCVLPLVPGYLSVVTGLDLPALHEGARRHAARITATTSLFIVGFGVVWVPLGAGASKVGSLLRDHQIALTRISGVIVIGFALFLLGTLFLSAPALYREVRFHPRLQGFGAATPVVLGVAFAFGWTPCIGPVLGSITNIAIADGRPTTGAALLAVYTLGMGLPFLVCGLAFGALRGPLQRVRRFFPWITAVSALVMLVFGYLLVTNQLSTLTANLIRFLDDRGLTWLVQQG